MSPAPAVTIRVNDAELRVTAGVTLAVALHDAGRTVLRRSASDEPRGPLCGMGICFECRVTIDGVPHRRACVVVVADGMDVRLDA